MYRNIFVYYFQNSLGKLLRASKFQPVNLFLHKNNLYQINTNIIPKLINLPENNQIIFQTKLITTQTVFNIIKNQFHDDFPFAINIYTSYTYIKHTSKSIENNMIGQYLPPSESVKNNVKLHLFITPNLNGDHLYMHKIEIENNKVLQKHSIFAHSHLKEGNKISLSHSTETEHITNNLHCICDHKDSERFFPPRKYNNLGNKNIIMVLKTY